MLYAKLENGKLVEAPYCVKYGGFTVVTATLTEAQANELGYKEVVSGSIECRAGEYAVGVGWEEREDGRIHRTYEVREIVRPPRKFSKLKIYGAVAALGKWAAFEAWLKAKEINGVNGWTAFTLAQEISEDHALFQPLAAEARTVLDVDETAFKTVLGQCELES